VPVENVEHYTVDQVRTLLKSAEGRTRLFVLLGLNCAFYRSDISTLKRSEVNLKAGTITRKRGKTDGHKGSPTVTYTLWKETARLLAAEMNKEGELALTMPDGRKLVDGGKDAVTDAFRKLLRDCGYSSGKEYVGCFKWLKKCSSTEIAGKYPGLDSLFNSHAPRSMADKHYSAAALGLLAKALKWLGKQYGV
jgi:integrase